MYILTESKSFHWIKLPGFLSWWLYMTIYRSLSLIATYNMDDESLQASMPLTPLE